eukprot:scaffold19211_cov145-Amphora_coffeaeformis.AAC.2
MKLYTALWALLPLVSARKPSWVPANDKTNNGKKPDDVGPPDHAGIPDFVLEKFREKFGVKPGSNIRTYIETFIAEVVRAGISRL